MLIGRTVRVEHQSVYVFLLMVIAALQHTMKAEVRMLDMAPDAVDDDFSECRDKMLKAVEDDLLQNELNTDEDFGKLWRKHYGVCKKNVPGGTTYHVSALQAYGNSKPNFRMNFNCLVHSRGNNITTYSKEFPFKSLHFLLTDSLHLLNPANTCRTVYSTASYTYMADTGDEVRFGKFLSVEDKQNIAEEDLNNKDTLFVITSCSVVKVCDYTCKCEEVQSLVSPAEVFRVQEVQDTQTESVKFTKITLTHSRFLSNHHCSFFHRNATIKSSSSLTFTLLLLTACLLCMYTVTV